MFFSRSKKAFTLLEVMLAVAVLGLVTVTVYRMVESTLTAVRWSKDQMINDYTMDSFVHYLRAQLQNIPASRQGALTGDPHKFSDVPCDELRWIATAGSGVLTRHAEGEWNVTLTTKQQPDNSYQLILKRQDIEGRNDGRELTLLNGVHGFEIRYYDVRAQSWVDKWTDLVVRPSLVRMRLWRDPSTEAKEVVFQLPAVTPGAQLPTFNPAQQPRIRNGNNNGINNGRPNSPTTPPGGSQPVQPVPPQQ